MDALNQAGGGARQQAHFDTTKSMFQCRILRDLMLRRVIATIVHVFLISLSRNTMRDKENATREDSKLVGKRRLSSRSASHLRTKFNRMIWAVLFLTLYLLFWVSSPEMFDDASGAAAFITLFLGAIFSAVLGGTLAPVIPRLLGIEPRNRQRERRDAT